MRCQQKPTTLSLWLPPKRCLRSHVRSNERRIRQVCSCTTWLGEEVAKLAATRAHCALGRFERDIPHPLASWTGPCFHRALARDTLDFCFKGEYIGLVSALSHVLRHRFYRQWYAKFINRTKTNRHFQTKWAESLTLRWQGE